MMDAILDDVLEKNTQSHFILNETLKKDSLFICDFDFTTLRLINNVSVPWCVIIPRKNNIIHLTDLSEIEQNMLMQDVRKVASLFQKIYTPDRVNIGMLGNMVPQMHWHVIARTKDDPAWPGPVWGNVPSQPYSVQAAELLISQINDELDKV